jgi:hypothetical protein
LDVFHLEDAVLFQDFAIHVTEQRESDANFFRKGVIGSRTVNADSQNDGVRSFQFGHISLIGLKFLSSTFGESENVKSENDVLLPAKIAKVNRIPVIIQKRKIRRHVASLQGSVPDIDVLGGNMARREDSQEASR